MRLDELRQMVRKEFGEGLCHATPANVRDFLDTLDSQSFESKPNRIVIDEQCTSYEEVLKDFFNRLLQLPPEEAVVALWPLALDLAFATIESQYSDRFAPLFGETE